MEIEKESGFVFKPLFKIKDKQVRLLLSNPEQRKTFLKIYDSSGILVANLKSKEVVLKKTLDFSNVPSGKYRIEIDIDGQNFTKLVSLE
ncbi:MAG TPA: T9SS type A sorting domain-containing protein [Gillisia sp.]|nr:T9SS type A sorting domain-containing protein [Gillisia sp.]